MSPESIFWKKVIYRCMRTVPRVPAAKGCMSEKCYGYLACKEKWRQITLLPACAARKY